MLCFSEVQHTEICYVRTQSFACLPTHKNTLLGAAFLLLNFPEMFPGFKKKKEY
jgi:hypothetical protein